MESPSHQKFSYNMPRRAMPARPPHDYKRRRNHFRIWFVSLSLTMLLFAGTLLSPAATVQAQVQETHPEEIRSDLGDAPDSTNHYGKENTAYPAVPGRFPTVWEDSTVSGPNHFDATLIWLGDDKSHEFEADELPDADGVTNILDNGTADVADMDRFDDGWLNRNVEFINCEEVTLKIRLSWTGPVSDLDHIYLNAFYDGNRDGDWEDTGECPQARSHEWLLQDIAFNNPTFVADVSFIDIELTTALVYNQQGRAPAWFRLMLSDRPVGDFSPFPADGRGPPFPDAFRMGETEDYLTHQSDVPSEVSIVKEADVTSAQIGDTITYKVSLINAGNVPATGYTMVDPIPAGTSYIVPSLFSSHPTANFDSSSNQIKWGDTIPANTTVTIEYKVQVTEKAPCHDLIRNIAVLTGPNGDSQEADVAVRVDCPNVESPRIVKRLVSPSPVAPGDVIEYEIEVANPNPVSLTGLTVFDAIPAGTSYVASGASDPAVYYDPGANLIKWSGTVPANGSVLILLSVQVDRDIDCGTVIRNQAVLLTPDGNQIPSNVVEVKVECPQAPNLDIVKKALNPVVGPGGTIEYEIIVYNGGTAPADVVMNDPIPAGTTYVSGSAYGPPTVSYINSTNSIRWTGTVPPQSHVTIGFKVTVGTDVDCGTVILNRASAHLRPAASDPDQSPDAVPVEEMVSSSAETKVRCPQVELDIVKSANVAAAAPGDEVEYTIKIENGTASPAAGFTMIDPIPAGTIYVAGSAMSTEPNVAYDATNNYVRWAGVVPPSGNVVITFRVTVEERVDCSALIVNVARLLDGESGALIGKARATVEIDCDHEREFMDVGDAPDSSNHHGLDNTAYADGTLGRFDTVWTNQLPSGPAHAATRIYWLGQSVTEEYDADLLPDADGVTNILDNGTADIANRDRGDDGWLNPDVDLLNCQTATLRVRISGSGLAPNMEQVFLNVWQDGNSDGDWRDRGECPNQEGNSFEWVVQNFAVDVSTIAAGGGQIDVDVPTKLVYRPDAELATKVGNWLRFTLSERAAQVPSDTALPDGRGPNYPALFRLGETEDYHLRLEIQGQPKLELKKRTDIQRVLPGNDITYEIEVHNAGTENALGVTVIDPIPAGTSYVAGSAAATAPTVSYHAGLNRIEWTGDIPAGGHVVIKFSVKVDDRIDCPTEVKNVAYILRADGSELPSPGVLVHVVCPETDGIMDFGDAPDSDFNHAVMPNTAYIVGPTDGHFPSVWEGTPATEASGPAHANAGVYWLGDRVTGEADADLLPDDDGVTNILNGGADVADQDRGDDGWLNPNVPLVDCERTTLKVRVSAAAFLPTKVESLYLNVWQDGNADGDWQDGGKCGNFDLRSTEWIVQDFVIDPAFIPAGGYIDLSVPTRLVYRANERTGNWIRFTLSERPAVESPNGDRPDGRGPSHPDLFRLGETEDVFRPGRIIQGEPGDIAIDKVVLTASSPVNVGDEVKYEVYLVHNGGTVPATTTMKDKLPEWVAISSLPVVTEINPSVSPLNAVYDAGAGPSGTVSWHGNLSPGAAIKISFAAQVIDCPRHEDGQTPIIVNTAVAEQTDGSLIQAAAEFAINCQPPTEPEIKLEKFLLGENDEEIAISDFLPAEAPVFYLRLSSSDGATRTVGISDTLPSGLTAVATSQNFGSSAIINGGQTVVWRGIIGPGNQPAIVKIEVRPTDKAVCDQRLVNVATWFTRHFRGESNPATLVLACRDLGDAPDSTNHAGVAMTAYAGVPANYPTVYRVAAPERGPMHLFPQPFHLGPGVSSEREADVGFDSDGINNIVPRVDRPDLDRRDDGVDHKSLTMNHCDLNRMMVEVSISPAMAALLADGDRKGYLNVWLDGNRDGDWDDALTCLFQGDIARVALEHIVIDHEVDITALGAGLHPIVVPTTGPVYFPATGDEAQLPAWLRVTLSERPANKPFSAGTENGDVAYGDGRGHDDPFRFGETEDYLVPPPSDDPQPDPTVRKRGHIHLDRNIADGTPRWLVSWIVNYSNLGAAPATNAIVSDEFDSQQTLVDERSVPNTVPTISGNTLTYAVGDIPPSGTMVIRTAADIGLAPGTVLRNEARVSADVDSDLANNTAVATVTVPILPPVIVTPVDGTTCDETVVISGKAQPNVDVDIYVDGSLETTVTADANGDWSTSVNMTVGDHQIYAVARSGGLVSAPSATVHLTVDPTAPWDYQSLRFTRADGSVVRPNGRLDASGWRIFLRPGQTYTVSLRVCCDDANAQVTLQVGNQIIILTDPDGDRIYEATFTAGDVGAGPLEGDITICVLCDGIEICSDGTVLIDPEGTVYDSITGAILEGATVTCFEEQSDSSGDSIFQMWDAAAFKQVNPQTTGTDGYYSFFTPAGTYQVDVQKEGYQPYRSGDLVVTDTPVEHDVYLTPVVSQSADHTVLIDDDGFDQSVLVIKVGDVVEWINVGAAGHAVATGDASGLVGQDGSQNWNSGQLTTGSSYKRQFNAEGSFSIEDPSDPSLGTTVIVKKAGDIGTQPEGQKLFLPVNFD